MTEGASEALPLGALLAAGWRPDELEWEQRQERALELAAAGDLVAARPLWAESLHQAREIFEQDDPRLATSLANHALGLRAAGDDTLAGELLEEAVLVWGRTGPWVEALSVEQRARSSTFHLRLARKNPGNFERIDKNRHQILAWTGAAALESLKAGKAADPAERLAQWRKQKPKGFTDGRKLLAAVLLLAG